MLNSEIDARDPTLMNALNNPAKNKELDYLLRHTHTLSRRLGTPNLAVSRHRTQSQHRSWTSESSLPPDNSSQHQTNTSPTREANTTPPDKRIPIADHLSLAQKHTTPDVKTGPANCGRVSNEPRFRFHHGRSIRIA